MTVSNTNSVVQYTGNGATVNWPTGFRFFKNTDLVVTRRSVAGVTTALILNTDYSVSGANALNGGTVTTTNPLAVGELLTIARVLTVQQLTDLRNQGDYFAEIHEDVFDYLTMLIQQTGESDSRALRHPRDSEHYQAEARRIVDMEDPVDGQDATTKSWVSSYFGSLIDGASGLINTTTGIIYDSGTLFDYLQTGVARVVSSVAELKALSKSRNRRAFLLGYYGQGTGGGGHVYLDETDTTSPGNDGTIFIAADGGRWKRPTTGVLNALEWGARGNDSFDNGAVFGRMSTFLAAYGAGEIFLPPGVYRTSATIVIGGSGKTLRGSGMKLTTIKNTTANLPTVSVSTGSDPVYLQDFTVDRSVPAIIGGDGVAWAKGGVADGMMSRIRSINNYCGFGIGGMSYSIGLYLRAESNYLHGFDCTNSNAFTTCQFYTYECYSGNNDGRALNIQSVATSGQMACGEWNGFRTFANNLQGVYAKGLATCPVQGPRIYNSFMGQDGGNEIELDTFGSFARLVNVFVEEGGTIATGRNQATTKTNASFGIVISANTVELEAFDCVINGQAYSGVYNNCQNANRVVFSGCDLTNNGVATTQTTPTYKSGFFNVAAKANFKHCNFRGQQYGTYNASTGGDYFIGCNMNVNSVSSRGGNTTGNTVVGDVPA